MKIPNYLYLFSLLVLLCPGVLQAEEFQWPQGQKAAVNLSYDDTLNSQLDNAIPTLNRYKLRSSFYLTLTSPVLVERMAEWRAAAKLGHELGNHTIYHGCSKSKPGRDWVKPYHDTDKRVVDQVRDEVLVANAFLYAIDGKRERTFTPPCVETSASDGSFLPAIRDNFVAIKGDDEALPEGFATYLMPSGQSGKELVELVERAANRHRVINIVFHGVGGDYLSVSTEAHETLVKYLAEHRDRYWTDTYLSIMAYLHQQSGG